VVASVHQLATWTKNRTRYRVILGIPNPNALGLFMSGSTGRAALPDGDFTHILKFPVMRLRALVFAHILKHLFPFKANLCFVLPRICGFLWDSWSLNLEVDNMQAHRERVVSDWF
jgi:hypothetical protein